MQAKCPRCFALDPECPKCEGTGEGTGEVAVGFASGNLFTRHCLNGACDFDNGGYITQDSYPPTPSGLCVKCNGPTEWLNLGAMGEPEDRIEDEEDA